MFWFSGNATRLVWLLRKEPAGFVSILARRRPPVPTTLLGGVPVPCAYQLLIRRRNEPEKGKIDSKEERKN